MSITLDPRQLDAARSALLGEDSDRLIDLLFRLNLRLDTAQVPDAVWAEAVKLGWVNGPTKRLTDLGHLVADPVREYRFWLDRERRLHAERDYPYLAAANYSGKVVLEVGSGFGCNLFSMSIFPGTFSGVEPVALYRQFTPVFAEREGIKCPDVGEGSGESIPAESDYADVVLCYSAHQYMDVRKALAEMARVLKPGGQLQIIGGTLLPYFADGALEFLRKRSVGGIGAYVLTLVNTIWYSAFARRLVVPRGFAATTAPVYPPVAMMRRWISECGLVYRPDLSRRIPGEMCFIADKLSRVSW